MKVTIELENVGKIYESIAAQERAAMGKSLARDFVMLTDTKSILEAIAREIENYFGRSSARP